MTDTNIYKQKLEEEKNILLGELSKLGAQDEKTGAWEADPEDIDVSDSDQNTIADRFEDFEERSATLGTLKERLAEVDEALMKIESGNYGKCATCNGPIEEERLSANPAAKTCKAHMEA